MRINSQQLNDAVILGNNSLRLRFRPEPVIVDDGRNIVLSDGIDDPERLRHSPVFALILWRASTGVSARDGSFWTATTRRSNSVRWDWGAGRDSRGMLAQSSSMSAIFSAGLAACSSGISASFIRPSEHQKTSLSNPPKRTMREGQAGVRLKLATYDASRRMWSRLATRGMRNSLGP